MKPSEALLHQDRNHLKKSLGQYFTGSKLSRFLAALAITEENISVLDPMAGSGDILEACLEVHQEKSLNSHTAIEIDPFFHKSCSERLNICLCIQGNAFSPDIISKLPIKQWDLVITNPPYVRYQTLAKNSVNSPNLPNAIDIRYGLLKIIDQLPHLDKTDRKLFKKIISSYSGLSDLAVPAWILCASLVAPGGRLALILPESWLSRDYASIVQYLLIRWFRIEYIIEDEHAVWFKDAQVKTNILIARRIPRKKSAFDTTKDETYLKINISGQANGSDSIIEYAYPDKIQREKYFSGQARNWLLSNSDYKSEMISATHQPLKHLSENIRSLCYREKWLDELENQTNKNINYSTSPVHIPEQLRNWLTTHRLPKFTSLEELEVNIGQGLRTGANSFFYCDVLQNQNNKIILSPSKQFGIDTIETLSEYVRPVIRRQSELANSYTVDSKDLKGRVLALQKIALPEDIKTGGIYAQQTYTPMNESLAEFIRIAAKTNIGTNTNHKYITELTAVAPNIRPGNTSRKTPPHYWYMLPNFAPRHTPDILIPRINNNRPTTLITKDKTVLVDANFSTLWCNSLQNINKYALLSLLNSSWCLAALELSSSIMGGGALKIEATHLRRLPIPVLSSKDWEQLALFGKKLALTDRTGTNNKIIQQINNLIVTVLLNKKASTADIETLEKISLQSLYQRKSHRKQKEV